MAPTEVQLPPKNLNISPMQQGEDTVEKVNEMIQRNDEVYRILREYVENGLANVNIISPIESNGGIPVNIQDQTTPPFDLYFIQAQGAPSTLASATAIDDMTISVTDDIIADGDYVGIFDPVNGRFYFGEATGAPTGTGPYTVTLDTPLDFAFAAGKNVLSFTRDLAVDGSVTTQKFEVQGPGSGDLEIDVTRLIFSITCDSQPDDGLFGNIASLTNGIVIRRKDGTYRNIANIKNNGDFANLAYDVAYEARSVPAGEWAVRCRYTFAGQDKHGVAIRLGADESLQILVQDDLTTGSPDITKFRVIAEGHIVTD